jgi:hypothetical protein
MHLSAFHGSLECMVRCYALVIKDPSSYDQALDLHYSLPCLVGERRVILVTNILFFT